MGRTKAVGPNNIPIEVWRGLGEEGIRWLTNLFNIILRTHKTPEEWRNSTLMPLFKNKSDYCRSFTLAPIQSFEWYYPDIQMKTIIVGEFH